MSFRDFVKTVNERGACVNTEQADEWFREQPRGPGAREIQRRQARQACAECPVRTECLTIALTHERESEMSWGIWGGVCARDRQEAIERAQGADSAAPQVVADLVRQLYSLAHPDAVTTSLSHRRSLPTVNGYADPDMSSQQEMAS